MTNYTVVAASTSAGNDDDCGDDNNDVMIKMAGQYSVDINK